MKLILLFLFSGCALLSDLLFIASDKVEEVVKKEKQKIVDKEIKRRHPPYRMESAPDCDDLDQDLGLCE